MWDTSNHAFETEQESPAWNNKEFLMVNAREQGFVGPDAESAVPRETKFHFLKTLLLHWLHLMACDHESD